MPSESLDPQVFGRRLAEARKSRGLTQEEVAKRLGCSRPTYIAVEKGERQAKPEEIVQLAALLGRSVHELLRPDEPVVALQPHLRAVAERMREEDQPALLEAVDEFARLAEDYLELERLVGAPLPTSYPTEVRLSPRVDVVGLAEDLADVERRRLGLGDQPIVYLRRILEWDVGLRVFYSAKLPSAVAGLYAHATAIGCAVLINRKHPAPRRRMSLAHEYAHVIVDRHKPGIDYLDGEGRTPANERFADAFAAALLMPQLSVRHRFHELLASQGDFQVADLCRMSYLYFVSVEAMALRLESLGLIPKQTWRAVKEAGFAPQEAQKLLELEPHPENAEVYPERYLSLAVQAFEQEKISQGQLARFLRCDPVTAREKVDQCLTSPFVDEQGRMHSLQLDFQRSLLADAS